MNTFSVMLYLRGHQQIKITTETEDTLRTDSTFCGDMAIWEQETGVWQAIGKLYHLRLRVECTFFLIYKAMLLCNSYTYQLYIYFFLGQKLKCRALLLE
jgi:hypothetical protein